LARLCFFADFFAFAFFDVGCGGADSTCFTAFSKAARLIRKLSPSVIASFYQRQWCYSSERVNAAGYGLAQGGGKAFDLRTMNLFDGLEKLINEHASAAVLRDHVALLKSQLSKFESDASVLQSEKLEFQIKLKTLQAEVDHLRAEIKKHKQPANQFHEFSGVLWKRTEKGFERVPYCPECSNHPIMFGQPPHPLILDPHMWQCSKCNFIATFSGRPT
jgi:hypothetical protein